MEKYQDYKIYVEQSLWNSFLNEFREIIQYNDWIIREDLIEKSKNMISDYERSLFCIETPEIYYGNTKLKGVIWMWLSSGQMEIFNIIPLIGVNLSCEQYNYILSYFDDSIINQISKNFNPKIEISKPYLDMEDIIGNEAFRKLSFFSDMANKSTGHSHPLDSKRWFDFLVTVCRSKKHLSSDDLRVWFTENGWSESVAYELSLDFEYSINLLEFYEQN